ncbi:hypothetical protein SASPL_156563 [Salvia splendens]|uniref:Protein NEDD1 n=1 Tax=Salvia splendens TaxID=180675 RepID=A0A8X8VWE7_SALSN|nr:hypothetical protein SASPL_156563 [Salvia splendens]
MNLPESAKLLLAASGGDTVKLFDISVEPQNPCVLTLSIARLSRQFRQMEPQQFGLASAGEDGRVSLWRKNGKACGWYRPKMPGAKQSSFSNKGSRYLCSGGTGQVVRIWDLQNKRCVKWLKGHTDTITGAWTLMDRHLLVTAGDDGSIHMWIQLVAAQRNFFCNFQASWLKQHSAPTSAVSFSPSNDKIIASVGLDMKLYTFDTGSKKPSSCIPYEAPFSSLAFTDDGLTLAAGTSTGQVVFYDVRGKPQPITVLRAYGNSEAVTNLCWQRSKPVMVNEINCSDDTVLLAGDVGILNPLRTGSGDLFSFPAGSASSSLNLSASEETPLRSSLLTGGALTRLHAPRSYNFKDDMEVFSPLMEVQSITPSVDKLWDDRDVSKKDTDRKSSFLFPSRRFGLSEEGTNNEHPIFDWKSNSSAKQDDTSSNYTQLAPASTRTKGITTQANLENLGRAPSHPRRFSSYAERIGATPSLHDTTSFPVGSPKSKKTGAETREELLNSLLSWSEIPSASGTSARWNDTFTKAPLQSDSQQGNSFTLQIFQCMLEETLASFQKSIHDGMRNLHLEILRQFHMQEMETSNSMGMLLENQAEIVKELQSLRKEIQQLRRML